MVSKLGGRVAALFTITLAAGAIFGAVPASAQPVATGSLAFSGDEGDYISGGRSYSYSTESKDKLTVFSDETHKHVSVSISGVDGAWWSLDLAAPTGESLAPGTYEGALRYPFQEAAPGLSLSGDGRGCNTLTGSFTVQKAVFGPHGYVQDFDATYEQHCEGGSAALRGSVHIANPVAPAELAIGLKVATDGTASTLNGMAYIHGTVSCTAAAKVTLSGTVRQVAHRVIIRGNYSTQVDCKPGAAVAWNATADPTGTTPYDRGRAEVVTQATALDPVYNTNVSVNDTTVVTLTRS